VLAVLLVATIWGKWLGLFTSVLSAAAFHYFHLPPTGRFTIADSRHWVALGTFLIAAMVASAVAELARSRASVADERRREADLAAELARQLLAARSARPSTTSTSIASSSRRRACAARDSTATTSPGCSTTRPARS
jgi:two-component system sensor histidine kinase KdpD